MPRARTARSLHTTDVEMDDSIGPTTGIAPDDHRLAAGFDALFDRVYPALVGLARRVADPGRSDPGSRSVATDVAVEVMAWGRRRRLDDSDRSVSRLVGRTLDRSLTLLEDPPHLCPLPPDLEPSDLLDADVLPPDVERSWSTLGIPSRELRTALVDVDRRVRRVGLASLGAGLSLEDVAALLDLRGDEALDALAEVAERLTVRRRDRLRSAASSGAA